MANAHAPSTEAHNSTRKRTFPSSRRRVEEKVFEKKRITHRLTMHIKWVGATKLRPLLFSRDEMPTKHNMKSFSDNERYYILNMLTIARLCYLQKCRPNKPEDSFYFSSTDTRIMYVGSVFLPRVSHEIGHVSYG